MPSDSNNTIPVPFDNVMFALRVIAEHRRTSAGARVKAADPEISEESRAGFLELAEEGERIANGRESTLKLLFGEHVVRLLALHPEAQPPPEPKLEWSYKSPTCS